jgi:hypothetical protein
VTPAMHEPTGSSFAGPALTIERLRLRAAGLDEAAARTLARLVAARLSPGLLRPPGGAGVGAGDVRVRVAARGGDTPEQLAERTAAAIAAALARGTSGVDAGGLP